MSKFWYYADGDDTRGPVELDELIKIFSSAANAKGTLVWREGFSDWKTADSVREIVEHLFRPPPLSPKPSTMARTPSPPSLPPPDITVHSDGAAPGQSQLPRAEGADRRGRTAFLIVFAIVVLTGVYLVNQVYGNSVEGTAYLIGELATPWIFLSAITWKIRRSTYTAATVLAVAALTVASSNFNKLQRNFDIQEGRAALQGIESPAKIDDALKQHPSTKFLQVMAMANKASTETNAEVEKLVNEIEPPALSKGVELVTANRKELEALRSDLKTAEANKP
jgi:hypothetical protein